MNLFLDTHVLLWWLEKLCIITCDSIFSRYDISVFRVNIDGASKKTTPPKLSDFQACRLYCLRCSLVLKSGDILNLQRNK